MDKYVGRVALVTGASVGIGAAVSKTLVKHGLKVIGCGRNYENLQKVSEEMVGPGSFHPVRCDVSHEDEVIDMFKKIKEEHEGVDICVNNAGLAHDSPLLSGAYSHFRSMLEVNVLGLVMCTQESFKSMKERGIDDGHIINISSMSGHRIINSKDNHFYSATKFAVKAIGEGIRNELAASGSKIRLTQISPGLVETEFFARRSGSNKSMNQVFKFKILEAEDIVNAVIYALSAPKHVQIHDILIRPTEQKS